MCYSDLNCTSSGREESKCLPISSPMIQKKKSLKRLVIDSKHLIITPLLVCKCKHDDELRFDGKIS